jgi:hypothetical protein
MLSPRKQLGNTHFGVILDRHLFCVSKREARMICG